MNNKVNEYRLDKIEIKAKYRTIDIQNLNMELIIYNDLFLEFITADLLITDSLNLIKRLPIVGGEEVIVEFSDQYDNPPIKLSFVIWKVSKQTEYTQANQLYNLHLVEPRWYKSMSMKVFDRKKDISSKIIRNIFNSLETSHSKYSDLYIGDNPPNIDIYSAGLTPYELIRKILYFSHDHSNNPWMFYQTLSEHRFESFDSIINKKSYTEIFLQPIHKEEYKTLDKTRIVEEWNRGDNQNKVNIDKRGSQKTDNITLSLLKKNLHFSSFDYEKEFNSIPTLEKVSLDRIDSPESKERCFISDDINISNQANNRTAIFTMLEDNVFYVNISGDTKFVSGTVIDMDIPSKETFNNGYQYEEDISGRFLITSSKHVIRRDSYRVTMELMKESLTRKL